MIDRTSELQDLVNRGGVIDLAAFGDCEIGTVSRDNVERCQFRCSKETKIYAKDTGDKRGMFDLRQDEHTEKKHDQTTFDCDGKLTIVGQSLERWAISQTVDDREADLIPGIRLQRVNGVNFEDFHNGGGVRLQNCNHAVTQRCQFKNITGTGKGVTYVASRVDEPNSIWTSQCSFANCNAPTGQSAPRHLKLDHKNHPARIRCHQLLSTDQLGHWKIHGNHSMIISECQVFGSPNSNRPGFIVPANFRFAGLYIHDCLFADVTSGIEAGAGKIFDRGTVVLSNITAQNVDYLGSISPRVRCFAFGKMRGYGVRKRLFSNQDIFGDWVPVEQELENAVA